jgi:hypothetical protein
MMPIKKILKLNCKRFNKINIKRKPFSRNSIKDDLLKKQSDLKQNQDDLLKMRDNLLKMQDNLKYINTSVDIKIFVTTVLVSSCGIYVFVV